MPSPETRSYVKRLMTYHWLYRRRLNQNMPALDETAAGDWPIYRPQDVPVANVPRAVQSFHAAAIALTRQSRLCPCASRC